MLPTNIEQKSFDDLAHIIVVGNEKGGAGKTTSVMHIVASLLGMGFKVASIDVDSRQQSLTHYLKNRELTCERNNISLAMPSHFLIPFNTHTDLAISYQEDEERFEKVLKETIYSHDFIVIDTPGSNSYLSQLAHSYADTLITPINDSFVDLDVLASVEGDSYKIISPGIYSDTVWKQKMIRAGRDKRSINWIVMRNRLSNIDAKNKRYMADILEKLSQRIGFRYAPGFSERVVFREMFLQGMTLLDLRKANSPVNMNLSHVAARQELKDFLKFTQIPKIENSLSIAFDNFSKNLENVA